MFCLKMVSPGRWLRATMASALLLTAVGCGDDGLARRYSVSGRVSYNGQPVTKGTINFVPDDPSGRGASGVIQSDGSYTLTTLTDRDGALPGTYRVSIVSMEADYSEAQATVSKYTQTEGAFLPPEAVGKATKKATYLVPGKYTSPDTSGLTAEVQERSNRIDFELTD